MNHRPDDGSSVSVCQLLCRKRLAFDYASLFLVFGLRPGCGRGLFSARENRRGRRLRRFVFLSDLDLATQNRAIFDDDAPRLHVACNSAGARNLDALALESANHFTVNDNFAGFDFCGNTGVGTDSETAIGNVNFSFERAIQEEIFPTRDFSFDLEPGVTQDGAFGETGGTAAAGRWGEGTVDGRASRADCGLFPSNPPSTKTAPRPDISPLILMP